MSKPPLCFFVIPFRPELNFFFLYVQKYLSEKHAIRVERGDHRVLTKALMEKIREQIVAADVIVAEISSANPNVFYEIGLAHAFGKPVIFLTQEPPESAPVDIRQFEFVAYNLQRHEEFLSKLDNAIQNVFVGKYLKLYEQARDLLTRFNMATTSSYPAAPVEDFQARVMRGELMQDLALMGDEEQVAEFLLPKILQDATDVVTMRKVMSWIGSIGVRDK